jgi:predicted regulator of Ras-like GTPase activity (Roadblock/LC7/MglB family)
MESVEEETARTVIIVAKLHYILTTPIDESTILVVVIDRKVDVGRLLPTITETADAIRQVLSRGPQLDGEKPTA